MQIVTVSGFKGGTGKTTLATLLSVAATLEGCKTAGLDLDNNTRNYGSILTRRRAAGLASPDHVAMVEFEDEAAAPVRHPRWLDSMVRMARQAGYELLVIDTGSGTTEDLYRAHVIADVVLTPLNESPADLHGLFAATGTPQAAKVNYRDLVESARFERHASGLPAQRWHVCRNRVSHLPTRLGRTVERRVNQLVTEVGLEAAWCVRDRVVHRAIALEGRTVLDAPIDAALTMSELAGRSEARSLLGMLTRASVREPMKLAA
jgi:cellulose biosynthesis protein BcsQ